MKSFIIKAVLSACVVYQVFLSLGCVQKYSKKAKVSYSHQQLQILQAQELFVRDSFTGPQKCVDTRIRFARLIALLDMGEDYDFGSNSFARSVQLVIKAYSSFSGEQGLIDSYEVPLTITPQAPEQKFVVDFTFRYEQINRFNITVAEYLDDDGQPAANDPLRLQVFYEEDFAVDVQSPAVVLQAIPLPSPTSANPVTFQWQWLLSTCEVIPNYQFQLLRLYNNDDTKIADETKITALVDWSQAAIIETESPQTSLTLTIAEGTGYYAWRVRPVGNYYQGGSANPQNRGPWSDAPGNGEIKLPDPGKPGVFFYKQFDGDKNLIYNRTFTEGNKISEQATYANGLLQVKQAQVHLPSQKSVLTTRTVLDHSGRPALTALAVPLARDNLGYETGLMQNSGGGLYNADNFDNDDNYADPEPVAGGKLAEYYSDANPDLTIPAAEGYPYSRARYYLDGTDRIIEQSGVGSTHRMGGGHTVRTLYGSGDDKLIRLFGDEAPAANSVRKVLTIDENLSVSGSYISKTGQTLATFKSISEAANELLDPLPSQANARETEIVEISGNTPVGPNTFIASKTILLSEPTTLALHYEITPNDILASCGDFCQTCDYEIQLLVKNLDNPDDPGFPKKESLTIPAGSCPNQTFNRDVAYELLPGRYSVEKLLQVNTENSQGKSYREQLLQQLKNHVKNETDGALAEIYAFLDAKDIAGLNDYLATELGADLGKDFFSLQTECCTIDIPIESCPDTYCGPIIEFEEMLFDKWGDTFGFTPNHYFFTKGCPTYSPNVQAILAVDFQPVNGVITQLRVLSPTGVIDLIENQVPYLGFLPLWTAVLLAVEINQNTAEHHFQALPIGNQILIQALDCARASIDDPVFYSFTLFNDFTPKQSFAKFEAIPGAPHPGGINAFDQLIFNMIADGYDCDSLWACWNGLVMSYDLLATVDGDPQNRNYDFDLLDAFLNCVGIKYQGVSNCPYDVCAEEVEDGYGLGYLDNAHKFFLYESGSNENCENQLGYQGPETWPPEETIFWDSLYHCVYSSKNLATSFDLPDDCAYADPENPTEQEKKDCAEALAAALQDSCATICDARLPAFMDDLVKMYHDHNMVVQGDLDEGAQPLPFDVSIIEIVCQAQQLVERCKQGCDLTIFYDPPDGDPDDPGTKIKQVGDPDQQQAFLESISYAYNLDLPEGGACPPSFELIGDKPVQESDIIQAYLEEKLEAALEEAGEEGFCWDYVAVLKELLGENLVIGDCNSDILQCPAITAPDIFGGLLPDCSDGLFLHPVLDYDVEVIKGLSGCTIKFTIKYSPDGGQAFLTCTLTCQVPCGSASCGQVCFQWVEPEYGEPFVFEPIPCEVQAADYVRGYLESQLSQCIDAHTAATNAEYQGQCIDNIKDLFTAEYTTGYHHYTLFYYDRAGNLVKTVAPQGVDDTPPNNRLQHPSHQFETGYAYNSLGQLLRQKTPDGGETRFWYDNKGQLRFSQNAEQLQTGHYSYTKYDNLGRIIEVGKSDEEIDNFFEKVNKAGFPKTDLATEKVRTVYSEPQPKITFMGKKQRFLQNRISYVETDERAQTIYSYDPYGNVEWLVQVIPGLGKVYIQYIYDLLSGNVLKIKYNEGRADQFFTRYQYDEDNRIIAVETSRDGEFWERDARYDYYAHGPLQRTVLGEDKVQGFDVTYTLQGWMKAANHPELNPALDPGQDGLASNVGADAFGMALNYFPGDFKRSGSPFNANQPSQLNPERPLYNGNITAWASRIGHQAEGNVYQQLAGNTFRYDELNRLTAADFHSFGNGWNPTTDFGSNYNYDANGNITKLQRNGFAAQSLAMDNLTYHYNSNTNQLNRIDDSVPDDVYDSDLDDQGANNYRYDETGNLTKDVQEGISKIEWTVYGKVKQVIKANGERFEFIYDVMGNRISKLLTRSNGTRVATLYARDAGGNVLAIYKRRDKPAQSDFYFGEYTLEEQPILGSARVGARSEKINLGQDGFFANGQPSLPDPDVQHIDSYRNLLLPIYDADDELVIGPGEVEFNGSIKNLRFEEEKAAVSGNLHDHQGLPGKNIASVEDACGNILFSGYGALDYAGNTSLYLVLDRNFQKMKNSEGIKANPVGKSLIIQKPGRSHIYYLVTVSNDRRAYYHVIDLLRPGSGTLSNPLGEVWQKNLRLDDDNNRLYGLGMALIEDLSGAGESRLFLRFKKANENFANIVSFPVTANGIGAPLVMGEFPSSNDAGPGEIQISPDGQRLAVIDTRVVSGKRKAELFRFNLSKAHDEFTSQKTFTLRPNTLANNFDFSPQGKFGYYVERKSDQVRLLRVNLASEAIEEITNLSSSAEVRRGRDGRMYVAVSRSKSLIVISNPEAKAVEEVQVGSKNINPTIAGTDECTGGLPLQAHKMTYDFSCPNDKTLFTRELDNKRYELSDHLGNVRVVVSDRKLSTLGANGPENFTAAVLAYNNFYPFGSFMPGRDFQSGNYRYGFHGMKKDDEVKGTGNSYTTEFRLYDPRVGRWLSREPMSDFFPGLSPYNFAFSNPIAFGDDLGLAPEREILRGTTTSGKTFQYYINEQGEQEGYKKITITREDYESEDQYQRARLRSEQLWGSEVDRWAHRWLNTEHRKGQEILQEKRRQAFEQAENEKTRLAAQKIASWGPVIEYGALGAAAVFATPVVASAAISASTSLTTFSQGLGAWAIVGGWSVQTKLSIGLGYVGATYFWVGYRTLGSSFVRLHPRIYSQTDIWHRAATFMRPEVLRRFPQVRDYRTIYWNTQIDNNLFMTLGANPWLRWIFHESFQKIPME